MCAIVLILCSCSSDKNCPMMDIVRVDSLVYGSNEGIETLRKAAPMFFPSGYDEVFLYSERNDSLMCEAYSEVDSLYDNKIIDSIRRECARIVHRARLYFKNFKKPVLYTYMSHWDYTVPVIYVMEKEALVVCLDLFLGKGNELYNGMYDYIKNSMERKNIGSAVAQELSMCCVGEREGYRLIDYMVYYGKILYIKSLLMGVDMENVVLDYTRDEYEVVSDIEEEIWDYYVRNGMLFKSSREYEHRFFNLAPYSVFYTPQDKNIPWGVGRYIGYRMVKNYMKRNARCSIDTLISLNADDILRHSGYNPHL